VLNGLYIGNDMKALDAANQWLGQPVDMVAVHTGRANWSDWRSSIDWQIRNIDDVQATARWSIPLFANEGNLASAAAHQYDGYYVEAARKLVAAYGVEQPIIVRTGEEFNGNWMPWAAAGKAQDFAQAYRNFVDAFRSVSSNFKFEWNVNIGGTMNPATAYPGDAYVDYIGMDFYWDSKQDWSIKDPVEAFNYYKNTQYGLQWLEDFAAAHGKATAYSEWGINSANAGAYLTLVKQWFDSHNVAYELYWDSNGAFAGEIHNGQYGAAGDVFRSLFRGSGGSTGSGNAVNPSQPHFQGSEGHDAIAPGQADQSYVANGMGGDDTLSFGNGNNYLYGGGGGDTITAANGNNHIYGNALSAVQGAVDGRDIITVGSGSNYVNGNGGDDVITAGMAGSGGSNRLNGGQGNDSIVILGRGANSANGNLGDDLIDARNAAGNNLLRGGQGNDRLYGGSGHDRLSGDLGNDTLHVSGASGHVTLLAGGAGNDLFDFSAAGAGAVAMIGGVSYVQEINDFVHGADRIDLAFGLAGGRLLQSAPGQAFSDMAAAGEFAQQSINGHTGRGEVAAVQVGQDSYLFYNGAGNSDVIDSVIKLDGVSAAGLALADFI